MLIGGEMKALNLGPVLGQYLSLLSIFPQFVLFSYHLWFNRGPTELSSVIFVTASGKCEVQGSFLSSYPWLRPMTPESLTHVSPSLSQRGLSDTSESSLCLHLSASDQGL